MEASVEGQMPHLVAGNDDRNQISDRNERDGNGSLEQQKGARHQANAAHRHQKRKEPGPHSIGPCLLTARRR